MKKQSEGKRGFKTDLDRVQNKLELLTTDALKKRTPLKKRRVCYTHYTLLTNNSQNNVFTGTAEQLCNTASYTLETMFFLHSGICLFVSVFIPNGINLNIWTFSFFYSCLSLKEF